MATTPMIEISQHQLTVIWRLVGYCESAKDIRETLSSSDIKGWLDGLITQTKECATMLDNQPPKFTHCRKEIHEGT